MDVEGVFRKGKSTYRRDRVCSFTMIITRGDSWGRIRRSGPWGGVYVLDKGKGDSLCGGGDSRPPIENAEVF